MSDVPVVGSVYFKRYPVFATVVVKVVKVEGDQVTYCDDDDVDLGRYNPEDASTCSIEQFHTDYHILGDVL